VKVGEGAFMATLEDARRLAEAMRGLGEEAGMDVVCLLTDMQQPLGRAVGNALEVREAYETISGGGPPDFRELVVVAATQLLVLSDLGIDEEEAGERVAAAIGDGSALAAYERWIRAQGGDPDPGLLSQAAVVREVPAPAAGFVREVWAREVAGVAMALGAGRERKEDAIDHAVGIVCCAKRGDRVERGQPLAEIHASDEAAAEAAEAGILAAYELGDEPERRPLVLDLIR
jgi:pyrimidine-nucleoside phosphorylase